MRTTAAAVLVSLLLGTGCSGERGSATATPSTTASVQGPLDGGRTAAPTVGPATPTAAPPAAETPTPAPSAADRQFDLTVSRIDARARARMRYSWRRGCPVPLADLRLLSLDHWGYDGRVHRGELVVHRDAVDAVSTVMRRLYAARFPIERMRLVDKYGGSDDRSMAANNTSAFNCRSVDGRPGVWSQHAFGRAIDINPLVNPYVRRGRVEPPEGARYADRSVPAKGLIRSGDVVVRAFDDVGWAWGGYWRSSKDYQHFSSTGR